MTIRKITATLAVAVALVSSGPAAAAPDGPAALSTRNDAAHAVTWSGIATLAPGGSSSSTLSNASATLGAQNRQFVPRLGPWREARAVLWIHWDTPEDLAVTVFDHDKRPVAASDAPPGSDEVVSLSVANNAVYEVAVIAKVGAPTPVRPQYEASLWVRSLDGTNFRGPRRLVYEPPNVCGDRRTDTNGDHVVDGKDDPPPPCYFRLTIPINVVFVGFDPAEVDAYTNEVLAQLPRTQDQQDRQAFRPVIASESATGGTGLLAREGGGQIRSTTLRLGSSIAYEPFEYAYTYNIVTATEQYSRALFAAAKSATTPGVYAGTVDRAYLERYNAAATALRRDHPVVPGSPVDLIDVMKLEDWVAAHPPKGIVSPSPAVPAKGYTYYVIDSYRPSYAGQYFNLGHYHSFRVMNSLTVDPDTGVQRGFDWGRVWGGRYRMMLLDVGAAPNGHEPAVSGDPTGDSSATDPPVWEYSGCVEPLDCRDLLPLFYERVGENVLYAMWMRFTRAYEVRPAAAARYLIASNTWHDADAYEPWPSRLDKLYNPAAVQARMKELLPFAAVDSSARASYLTASSAEQAALAAARSHGRGGSPGTASPDPVVRLIESKRSVYAPVRAETLTIPVVNAVFPGRTAWDAAGSPTIVASEGADAFGVLSSVDDLTKWNGATATVKDSSGAAHAPGVADPRASAPATVGIAGGIGFTAGAVRGAAHMLGLFPPTEGIAYAVLVPGDLSTPTAHPARQNEQERAYYRVFDPMYATTATPLSDAFVYNRFEVLDKETLWIGQAVEWLSGALDYVADTFAALDAKGYTQVTPAVTKAIITAGRSLGVCVGSIQGGLYAAAVERCRAAKTAMLKPLVVAVRTVANAGDVEQARLSSSSGARAPVPAPNALSAPVRVSRRPAAPPWLWLGAIALGVVATAWVTRPRRRAPVVAVGTLRSSRRVEDRPRRRAASGGE